MSLHETIKADMITAMKNKDNDMKTLLRVVLGEIATESKKPEINRDLTDSEITAIINKMKKNAIEMNNEDEVKILDRYLPTMLEPKQLETLVLGIINKNGFDGMKDMGKVMGILKSQYGGSYDGKLASQIVKDKLQ
jgi:uncharacterized protein YqeY